MSGSSFSIQSSATGYTMSMFSPRLSAESGAAVTAARAARVKGAEGAARSAAEAKRRPSRRASTLAQWKKAEADSQCRLAVPRVCPLPRAKQAAPSSAHAHANARARARAHAHAHAHARAHAHTHAHALSSGCASIPIAVDAPFTSLNLQ